MNILIIGATSGIGYELWKHYSTTGNIVAITGRRNEILQNKFKTIRTILLPFSVILQTCLRLILC